MNLITREELRHKLAGGEDFKLVMTLSVLAYREKHIPRSCHFETIGEAFAALDRSEEIVVYCSGVHCAASIYAYHLLEREGYARVRRYAGGIADWEEAGYPLEGVPLEPANERQSQHPRRRKTRHELQALLRVNKPWHICA